MLFFLCVLGQQTVPRMFLLRYVKPFVPGRGQFSLCMFLLCRAPGVQLHRQVYSGQTGCARRTELADYCNSSWTVVHDTQRRFRGTWCRRNGCSFRSILRASLSCNLVHVHGAGLSHHAGALVVSQHNWNWHQRSQGLAVSSYGRTFSDGGELPPLSPANDSRCSILDTNLFAYFAASPQISLTLNFFFFPISLIRVFLNRKISAPVGTSWILVAFVSIIGCLVISLHFVHIRPAGWMQMSAPNVSLYALTIMAQPSFQEENPDVNSFQVLHRKVYVPCMHFLFSLCILGMIASVSSLIVRWDEFKKQPFSPAHSAFLCPTLSHANAVQGKYFEKRVSLVAPHRPWYSIQTPLSPSFGLMLQRIEELSLHSRRFTTTVLLLLRSTRIGSPFWSVVPSRTCVSLPDSSCVYQSGHILTS